MRQHWSSTLGFRKDSEVVPSSAPASTRGGTQRDLVGITFVSSSPQAGSLKRPAETVRMSLDGVRMSLGAVRMSLGAGC